METKIITTVFKIKVVPIWRLGRPPGYKVYINGKKYPLGHGYWYATQNKTQAIRHALDEYDTNQEPAAHIKARTCRGGAIR